MRRAFFLNIPLLILASVLSTSIYAHSGRTDSSGCHTCRTNCPSYGLSYGEYHCHGGGSVQGVQESQPIYTPPTNMPIPWPTWTPIPTKTSTPTITPTSIPTLTPTITIKPKIKKITKLKKTIKIQKRSFWEWLFNYEK